MSDPLRALCRAALEGNAAQVAKLLEDHADLRHSVHAAAVLGDLELAESILESDAAAARTSMAPGWTPLMLATHSALPSARRGELVRRLLANGADPLEGVADNDVPGGVATPLGGASGTLGDADLARALLEAGAPAQHGAALHLAVARCHWPVVDLLIARGAALDDPAPGEFPPLHWMLDVCFVRKAVEELLARGADPNRAAGECGETALHIAVRRGRLEILPALVEAKANIEASTRAGLTAHRHALRRNFTDVAEELLRLGASDTVTPLDELAVLLHTGALDQARERLERAPELAVPKSPEEARIFPDLAAAGRVEAVALLLEHGADIGARGLDGGTALHQVAWFGQPDVARLLIERGAPLAVRGDQHDTSPLGWATHGSRFSGGAEERSEVYVAITEMLLEAGAPLPGPDDRHDRRQLAQATEPVAAVLARHGWSR
ncbi:MAG: hypothetical protein GY711_16605 [bacterium]|nr:hypothetical protein [bacterium]